jgi:CRP/FNR family transcriptional regulator, cyclic AMP receptor protein
MNEPTITDYLRTHTLFSDFSNDDIIFLSDCANSRSIKKGSILFRQGEPAQKFYIILSGQISIEVPAIMGPELEIQTVGKNQVLGWSWLISPYRWSFQAEAEVDSELLEFDGDLIRTRCDQDPQLGYTLLKKFADLMATRLDAARQKMMDAWNPAGFA